MNSPAVLVVVAGTAGAGKSRFGSIVAERTNARRLDVTQLLDESDDDELPGFDDYASLLAVAGKALESGHSVVVIGPFHTLASRKEVMRVASDAQSALLYVECSANDSVRKRRLRDELIAAEKLTGLDKRLTKRMAQDDDQVPLEDEIPRACQMLIDTTIGLSLWASLAACRVEAYVQIGVKAPAEQQAVSAG